MGTPFEHYLPSLERARREGVRAWARRWWRGGEATNLLEDEPDETHELAALIVGDGAARVACLPRTTPALDAALGAHFEDREDPPECLRIDLVRGGVQSPYRTAAPPQDLRRRELLDALGRAPGPGSAEAVGWAWPFVWLRFGGRGLGAPRDVALVVGPDRLLRAIVAPPR